MNTKEKPESKTRIWRWIGFYIIISFLAGLTIALPPLGGLLSIWFIWSWNKKGKQTKELITNIRSHPWRIAFTVLVAFAMFVKASSILLGVLVIILLIWLFPNTEKESLAQRLKAFKSHKVKTGVSTFLVFIGLVMTIGLHSSEKLIEEQKAFVESYPTPVIQVETIPNQGANTEYDLIFTVKDAETVTINGEPVQASEGRVDYKVSLSQPTTSLKIEAKNEYKQASKNIAIQRDKTEEELLAEEAERKRQAEIAKQKVEQKRKQELNSVDESQAFIISKNFVQAMLKSPKTADFPFLDYSHRNLGDGKWIIQSYVDSQNGFGAMIRTQYQVEMQFNGGDWAEQRNWTLVDITTD
jgi:hypothetical protein